MWGKVNYFLTSLQKKVSRRPNYCPYCHADLENAKVIDRKYAVTSLVECPSCLILVRTPTDDVAESEDFYQSDYTQGYTTDCPPKDELARLLESGFVGAERDYSRYLRFFDFLNIAKSCRILDFGCSWGYGLYQMKKAGYQAEGFEVSLPRARYGVDNLDVKIYSREEDIRGNFDVIFSSHVLEHLPDFTFINELRSTRLNAGGRFVAVTPNGSADFLNADYKAYHQLWGKVHPVLQTDRFVRRNFGNSLCFMDSWDSMTPQFKDHPEGPLNKFELVYVLKQA